LASFLGQDKKELRQGLDILKAFFRDAMTYKETTQKEMVMNADYLNLIISLANRLSIEKILANIVLIEKSNELIDMSVNKSLTLEALAFKLYL
jgi:DNA polymerase III subunit delta'